MIAKPAEIVDREAEWAVLNRAATSPRPELIFVVGRRRVGKSFLLAPFAQLSGGLYYQASRRSEGEQLLALTRMLGEHFDDPALRHGARLPSWDALFGYLKDRVGKAPFVLVLDEYPYLEEVSPGLSSVLQRWWDHDLQKSQLKLILSGSYVAAMRRLDAADQPLHARRTRLVNVDAFDPFDAASFYPSYSARDRVLAWSIFGGLPGHLGLIDPSSALPDNIATQILDPSARLYEEGQTLLDGLRAEPALHHSILAAVAAGEHTWKGITKRTGKSSGSLSRPLQWLLDMGLVKRWIPITETNLRTSKRVVYKLADPYLIFWHRFVAPLAQAGLSLTAAPEALFRARVEPRLDDYMGPLFEDVCRAFLGKAADLPLEIAEVGTWWDGRHEADVVARSVDGRAILVGECKWGSVDTHDLARLRGAAAVLGKALGVDRTHLALFYGQSLDVELEGEILSFSLDDLFRRIGPGQTPPLPTG